jgi:hypothetical protein
MHLNVIELARIPLRGATQPLGLRWGFETTSRYFPGCGRFFPDTEDYGSRIRREYIYGRESIQKAILNPDGIKRIWFHQPGRNLLKAFQGFLYLHSFLLL